MRGRTVCSALQVAPSAYRRHAARQRDPALLPARARRDASLLPQVQRVYDQNLRVYGTDKVWRQLRREGTAVARCTVERLMRLRGLQGVRRGKGVRTTVPGVGTSPTCLPRCGVCSSTCICSWTSSAARWWAGRSSIASAEKAAALLEDICRRQGISANRITVHSDNGGPM